MEKINFKRYGLYLLRWQASTPILAGIGIWLASMGQIVAAIVANLIGGLIFFWIDQYIFTSQNLAAQWEIKDNIKCSDCGKTTRGYRLVRSSNYDKSDDKEPKFRCEDCSKKKSEDLNNHGIKTQ